MTNHPAIHPNQKGQELRIHHETRRHDVERGQNQFFFWLVIYIVRRKKVLFDIRNTIRPTSDCIWRRHQKLQRRCLLKCRKSSRLSGKKDDKQLVLQYASIFPPRYKEHAPLSATRRRHRHQNIPPCMHILQIKHMCNRTNKNNKS